MFQSSSKSSSRRHFLRTAASGGIKAAALPALLTVLGSARASASGRHSAPDAPVCLLAGTLIETKAGARPVESLQIGDLVKTADGRFKPLKWLGHMGYWKSAGTAFSDGITPVRIAAGALGDNVPARDLFVSPRHALFLDGILVRAADLVNDVTITEEAPTGADRLDYYNLEFAAHEVVYAEGAAVESFQAHGQREMFENFDDFVRLYGHDATFMAPYAPVYAYYRGRDEVAAALRRVSTKLGIDLRDPLQVRYDRIVARALDLAAA